MNRPNRRDEKYFASPMNEHYDEKYTEDLERYCDELEKARIMYSWFDVSYYTLRTFTTMSECGGVSTGYYVEWHCKHGDVSHFEQEISKDEYEYLFKELKHE